MAGTTDWRGLGEELRGALRPATPPIGTTSDTATGSPVIFAGAPVREPWTQVLDSPGQRALVSRHCASFSSQLCD